MDNRHKAELDAAQYVEAAKRQAPPKIVAVVDGTNARVSLHRGESPAKLAIEDDTGRAVILLAGDVAASIVTLLGGNGAALVGRPLSFPPAPPAAAVPVEPVAWQYRFATPDGLTWSGWQQISSEAMAREMVDAFGKAGTRAEWRSLKVFEWGGYAGECTDADFADERARQPAALAVDEAMAARAGGGQ